MNKRICFITGSRAEYGLLRRLMLASSNDPSINLQVIATGSHLSLSHGLTYKEIILDGIQISSKVNLQLKGDSSQDIIHSMSIGLRKFSASLTDLRPDLIVVLGDRYEIFVAATAAMILNIPIAHIHGGETTEGAYDEAIRHSVTKMSHLHFVAAKTYKDRVIQLGENPKSVFLVGGLGVDAIKNVKLLSKKKLESEINYRFGERNLLVTIHPETLVDTNISMRQIKLFLSALNTIKGVKFLFTLPNADTGNTFFITMIKKFCSKNPERAKAFTSLGQLKYLSALRYVDGVIGNSSSGLTEVPSFNIGTINVGKRQAGRLRAKSVIDCEYDKNEIINAVHKIFSTSFQNSLTGAINPYGQQGASRKILKIIKNISLKNILHKKFYDLYH